MKKKRLSPLVIVLGSLFLVIVPFIIWSSMATLDQIAHATGQVIAQSKTQQIQSVNDGVIEQIFIKEGEKVKQGQKLVLLEKAQTQAQYDEVRSKVAALQAALTRLQAEVYGKPLNYTSLAKEYPEFIANNTELYHRRKQALNDEIASLGESLKLAQEELNLNLPLLEHGDIGKAEIIKLKRQIADLKGQISNKRNKYFQDSQAEMTKIEEELSGREQEMADKVTTLERTTITAPMDAVVKNIIITTQGAKVKPGDIILELVPSGDDLVIEAKLNPTDVSFVRTGQQAAIKLDAYDYSIYGIFDGKVKYISPDTIIEKTPEGDKPYFRVLVTLDRHKIVSKNGKPIEIAPGMTTQIDIVTGNRSVLTYLTKPVVKTMSESFHER